MYHGEDVCLSRVEAFRGGCISRTANTDGPRSFYSGKRKRSSRAVCGSANEKCMVFVPQLIQPASQSCVWHQPPQTWRKTEEVFSFSFASAASLWRCQQACRRPSRRRLVDTLWHCASLCLNAHELPSPFTVSQQGVSQVTWHISKSQRILLDHEAVWSSRFWDANVALWPVIQQLHCSRLWWLEI